MLFSCDHTFVTAMTTQIEATVNRPYLPERGGGLSCEITVNPGPQETPADRHISICIDTSGSMDFQGKLDQVRDAIFLVFGLLNEDDYLSIVSFDTDIDVIMDAKRWGNVDREMAERLLEQLVARGGTDLYAGVEQARDTLEGLGGDEQVSKRILLLSDGRDTGRDASAFSELAKDVADQGVSIYSAGIGTYYDKDVIRLLGEETQGQWTHVNRPTDIRSFFGDVVQAASTVVANSPQLVIDPAPGTEIAEVYRRTPQVQEVTPEYEDDDVIVGLPDLQDGEQQQVVLKMDAPGRDVGDDHVLANVGLEAGSRSASTEVSVGYTDDPAKLAQQDENVYLAHRDTAIRSSISRVDSEGDLDSVEALIDETEVITGETQIIDTLRDDVTRIEAGDEEDIREVQEQTTVVYEGNRFE